MIGMGALTLQHCDLPDLLHVLCTMGAGRPWAEVAESRVAHDFTAQSNISTFRGVYRAPASGD